ncbi:MAG: hypothetical protein K6G38_03220 [Gammaproteobacteria bacterium]|nr:hypothetical protein [Gammaproteobacteria bacterium]
MKVKVFTPSGIQYEERNATYVLAFDKVGGAFGMLENHLPLISTISRGYIAVTKEDKSVDYIAISGAILKNRNNDISITCESVAFGKSKDEALENFEKSLETRRTKNRERNIELALAENELKKEIKKSGAGHL